MKILTFLALLFGANAILFFWGAAPLVWSTTTNDKWNRVCRYYYPVRTFDTVLPLNEDCPRWSTPR